MDYPMIAEQQSPYAGAGIYGNLKPSNPLQ